MAMSVNFGGQTIWVPGVYSRTIPATGALSFPATGRVAIIGEASKGGPGSVDGVLQFTSDDLGSLASYFGKGELSSAAKILVNPSNDPRIPAGASSILVYKTNSSTKAQLELEGFGLLNSNNFGQEENLIAFKLQKVMAILGSKSGSASDVSGTDLTGFSFSIRELGGAINTFTCPDAVANRAALDAALADADNWSGALPESLVFSSEGADSAVILSIALKAYSDDHKLGFGRTVELISAESDDLLAFLGISEGLIEAIQEPKMRSIVSRQSDGILEDSDDISGDLGGEIYLEVGCDDTTCVLSITSTKLMTVAATAESLDINLSDFSTLDALAEFIDSKENYSCSVPEGVNGGLSTSVLDRVSDMGIASKSSKPGKIKADAYSLFVFYNNNSTLVSLERSSFVGLPDAISRKFLSGGTRGASSTSDFIAGLTELEKFDLDFIICLVSQDASDDLEEDMTSTDSASSYDVDAILASLNSHCRKMSSTKRRKERQAYAGYRGTFEECRKKALSLNSEYVSLLIQDILVPGPAGDLVWMKPHMAACLMAGMHAGAEVGQPVTRKYLNCQGIKHVKKQGVKPNILEEFDPRVSLDPAIQNGITPLLQPASGGVRCVVHNTTYTKDSNFVYNRAHVLYAGNFVARTLREQMEAIFIGEKNKTSTPSDIVAYLYAIMADFLRADIIVGDDTNDGLGFKNLAIKVQGNTIYIDITVTLVEGIDFILPSITLDRARVEI